MKYRFDSTFPELGFIKELLKEFNLPNMSVVTDDTIKFYDGEIYIKDLDIVKYYKKLNGFKKIGNYYFNRPMMNLSSNIIITSSTYGSDIHEYLGNYLRFLRDYRKINLMSLYNCFSNRTIFPKGYDEQYNYYAAPVKFNEKYTIGFDSPVPIEIYCTLWNNVPIELPSSLVTTLEENTRIVINNCSINKPIIYDKLMSKYSKITKEYEGFEDYIKYKNSLRLVIKMPIYNKTSITILEGDYSFNSVIDNRPTTTGHFGFEEDKYHYKNYPTNLSLLSVNDNEKHPFADRLIEYLLDAAVTNVDELDENIKRTQDSLLDLRHATPKVLYGDWDETMNDEIYYLVNHSYLDYYQTKRYLNTKNNTLVTPIKFTKDGPEYKDLDKNSYKNLIDIKSDLLMYTDKDVEGLFLAAGGE